LRGMMAQLLGARLSGESDEIFSLKPGMGEGPFNVAFDELAYYATNGMDRMLAMGRGLNIMFWLGFQEVSGIWARLGEKTASLLGNANLTIAMRQQDANRTRDFIEKTAGQTYVTQATSFQGGSDGVYREAQQAEMRQVSRIDWNDLQTLLEGEAIVLFGGRRIYAKLFYAKVNANGLIRLNAPLMLAAPALELVYDRHSQTKALADVIAAGDLTLDQATPLSPVLQAMIDGFKQPNDADVEGRVASAIEAVEAVEPDPRPDGLHAEPPEGDFRHMLGEVAEGRSAEVAGQVRATGGAPPEVVAQVAEIERLAGASSAVARRNSLDAVSAGHTRSCGSLPEPPPMTVEGLRQHIDVLVQRLAA